LARLAALSLPHITIGLDGSRVCALQRATAMAPGLIPYAGRVHRLFKRFRPRGTSPDTAVRAEWEDVAYIGFTAAAYVPLRWRAGKTPSAAGPWHLAASGRPMSSPSPKVAVAPASPTRDAGWEGKATR